MEPIQYINFVVLVLAVIYTQDCYSRGCDKLDYESEEMYRKSDNTIIADTCKWLTDDAKWYYTPWSIDFQDRVSKIEIIGDTLIGNRLCSVLGSFREDKYLDDSDLVVYYDGKDEKVYFHEDDSFKLLYDFSPELSLGDTLDIQIPNKIRYYDISSNKGEFLPTEDSYKFRIVNQRWIMLPDGDSLRVLDTAPFDTENGQCFLMDKIIVGVGSATGILGKSCKQLTGGKGEYFRCFESQELNYSEVDGECTITSTKNIISKNQVNVSYNYATQEIRIETDLDFESVNIYNDSGINVYSHSYDNRIRIMPLVTGIYYVLLTGSRGIYTTPLIVRF